MALPPSINNLPDDVLEAVFAKLELQERQRAIPLVCRHWNEVVHSQYLVDWLIIKLDCSNLRLEDCVFRMCSLRNWLVRRAARHVWRLELTISLPVTDARRRTFDIGLDGKYINDWNDWFESALAACGNVAQLALVMNFSFNLNSLTRNTPHLEALSVAATGDSAVEIVAPLKQPLKHLQFAAVKCLHFGGAAALPPTLTSLAISGDDTDMPSLLGPNVMREMPIQIGALPRLERLSVDRCDYGWEDCPPLQHLRSTLTQLRWTSRFVPSNLDCLIALRSLTLGNQEIEALDELDVTYLERALPDMANLTQLVLNTTTRVPATLTALQQLSSLCIAFVEGEDRLPSGGWLRSVRRLAASTTLLAASLPNLGCAGGLSDVGVLVYEDELDVEPRLRSIVDWAGQQQQLQRLLVDHPSEAAAADAAPLPPRHGFEQGHDFMHHALFPTDTPGRF